MIPRVLRRAGARADPVAAAAHARRVHGLDGYASIHDGAGGDRHLRHRDARRRRRGAHRPESADRHGARPACRARPPRPQRTTGGTGRAPAADHGRGHPPAGDRPQQGPAGARPGCWCAFPVGRWAPRHRRASRGSARPTRGSRPPRGTSWWTSGPATSSRIAAAGGSGATGRSSAPPRRPRRAVSTSSRRTCALSADRPGAPFALALSARSRVFQEFDLRPGQVAIHGLRNIGGRLGTRVSHGCVRLGDDGITWLAGHIPPGVPVTIR